MKWPLLPLKQLADFDPAPPRKQLLLANPVVAFMPMASVVSESSVATTELKRPAAEVLTGYTYFRTEDVLVAKITPCFENGKIAIADISHECGFGTTEFHVIRVKPNLLDAKYLTHFLRQPWVIAEGERKMTGSAGQRRVPRHFLERLEIPVPPIEEQRRIAAILDQAEALRAKRRQALAKLGTLTQSLFLEIFGDPSQPSSQWPSATLGQSVQMLQYGPRFYNESYVESGVRIARITDLNSSGELDYSQMPKLDVSEADKQNFILQAGDIIFARTGATVGKVSCIRDPSPECIAGAYFIRIRFDSEKITPDYAYAALGSASVQGIIANQSRQAAQQNFSGPGLRRLPLPLAPLSLQREFSRRVRQIEQKRKAMKVSAEKLDRMCESLQHRAFRGEL